MEEFESMFGWIFGNAFDLNHDGHMDDFERMAAFGSFVEMCEADVKSGRDSDYEHLSFMDYDEKVEYPKDLGPDPENYDWEDY